MEEIIANIDLEEIKTIAKQKLRYMGVKVHFLGFKYWTTAIYTIIDTEFNNEQELRMMELYYIVAKKHKTTASKVERAMRYAYKDIDLKKYFNVSYSVNNTALLFLLKEAVMSKYVSDKNVPQI